MLSRNQREGRYLGYYQGRHINKRTNVRWPVSHIDAGAFQRGRMFKRMGVVMIHADEQQGAY